MPGTRKSPEQFNLPLSEFSPKDEHERLAEAYQDPQAKKSILTEGQRRVAQGKEESAVKKGIKKTKQKIDAEVKKYEEERLKNLVQKRLRGE